MTKQVEAVYENGVLRPLEPLSLNEHQRVTLTVSDAEEPLASMIDHAFVEKVRNEVRAMDHIPTLEEVRRISSKMPTSWSREIIGEREDRF